MKRSAIGGLVASLGALMLASALSAFADKPPIVTSNDVPSISITRVPGDAPGERMASKPIEGEVAGVVPSEVKVVIYALGDVYYAQPWDTRPLVTVKTDGKWTTPTHGGLEFVALLVKPNYRVRTPITELPKVGGDVMAIAHKKPGE